MFFFFCDKSPTSQCFEMLCIFFSFIIHSFEIFVILCIFLKGLFLTLCSPDKTPSGVAFGRASGPTTVLSPLPHARYYKDKVSLSWSILPPSSAKDVPYFAAGLHNFRINANVYHKVWDTTISELFSLKKK